MTDKPNLHPGSPPDQPELTPDSRRPQDHDLFSQVASTENFHNTDPASPPYRSVPSSSNVNLNATTFNVYAYPPSPAYDSTVHITNNEKTDQGEITVEPRLNESDSKPKPTVHYPDEVHSGPAPSYRARSDSPEVSRPPSIAGTDDEDEIENYDWSGEEDLVDEEAKFEKQMGIKPKPQGWGPKRIITLLFSSLIGSLFLSGILITPAILLHFYWYKPNPTPHRLYIKQNVQAWLFWAAANLLISWHLAMMIDIIPAIVRFIISASWGHVSERIKSRIEMYNSVKDTIKPLFYAASGWVSWIIIFGHIFVLFDTSDADKSRAPYTKRVSQVIQFLFFLALVICAQQMLSHVIAFGFHRTAFKDRINTVTNALAVIEKLRNYRPKPTPGQKSGTRTPVFGNLGFSSPSSDKENFTSALTGALRAATPDQRHRQRRHASGGESEGYGEDADADTEDGERTVVGSGRSRKSMMMGSVGKGKQKKRSSWMGTGGRQKADGTIRSHNDHPSPPASGSMTPSGIHSHTQTSPHRYPPSTVDGDGGEGQATIVQAAKVLKTAVLHDARNITKGNNDGLGGIAWNVNSAHEAKHLARSIYMRFKDRRRTYLLPSDFYPAFATPALAESAFRVFDKDNNGDISRAEIKTTLLKVYKERRSLWRSMRDVGVALKTLDQILLFFALVILFFISLSVFGVEVGDSLTSVYSVGIAASFIFKNAASSAFDAIMFLFVTHPYDTGDLCFIDEEVLVVKKMGLFATVFTRVDGTETYYFNSQLFTKFITNVRRSGNMFENLTMQVAWRTPLEKLDALEKNLNSWLATEENRWFEPSTSITLQQLDFQRYLEITIGIAHNGTWQSDMLHPHQDWGLRCARKTAFHAAVQYYCRQLDIVGYESPLPIVYGDPSTQTYNPSTPLSPGFEDATSPGAEQREFELGAKDKDAKAVLGFLPPLLTRSPHLTRARKSKSRKAMMRGMGG